jgi:hypothetical protein
VTGYKRLRRTFVLSLIVTGLALAGSGCGKRVIYSKQEVLDSNWVVPDSPVTTEVENSSTQTTDHVVYFLSPQPVIDVDRQVITLEVQKEVARTTRRTIVETFEHELHQRTRTTTKYTEGGFYGGLMGCFIGMVPSALIGFVDSQGSEANVGAVVGVMLGGAGLGILIGLAIESAANTKTKTEETDKVVDTKLVTTRSPEITTQDDVVSRDPVGIVDVGVESNVLSEGGAVLRTSNGFLTIPFELGYPYVLADGDVDAASRVTEHLRRVGCRSASPSRVRSRIQAILLPLRVWTISGDAENTQDAEGDYKFRVYKATEGIEAAAGCR